MDSLIDFAFPLTLNQSLDLLLTIGVGLWVLVLAYPLPPFRFNPDRRLNGASKRSNIDLSSNMMSRICNMSTMMSKISNVPFRIDNIPESRIDNVTANIDHVSSNIDRTLTTMKEKARELVEHEDLIRKTIEGKRKKNMTTRAERMLSPRRGKQRKLDISFADTFGMTAGMIGVFREGSHCNSPPSRNSPQSPKARSPKSPNPNSPHTKSPKSPKVRSPTSPGMKNASPLPLLRDSSEYYYQQERPQQLLSIQQNPNTQHQKLSSNSIPIPNSNAKPAEENTKVTGVKKGDVFDKKPHVNLENLDTLESVSFLRSRRRDINRKNETSTSWEKNGFNYREEHASKTTLYTATQASAHENETGQCDKLGNDETVFFANDENPLENTFTGTEIKSVLMETRSGTECAHTSGNELTHTSGNELTQTPANELMQTFGHDLTRTVEQELNDSRYEDTALNGHRFGDFTPHEGAQVFTGGSRNGQPYEEDFANLLTEIKIIQSSKSTLSSGYARPGYDPVWRTRNISHDTEEENFRTEEEPMGEEIKRRDISSSKEGIRRNNPESDVTSRAGHPKSTGIDPRMDDSNYANYLTSTRQNITGNIGYSRSNTDHDRWRIVDNNVAVDWNATTLIPPKLNNTDWWKKSPKRLVSPKGGSPGRGNPGNEVSPGRGVKRPQEGEHRDEVHQLTPEGEFRSVPRPKKILISEDHESPLIARQKDLLPMLKQRANCTPSPQKHKENSPFRKSPHRRPAPNTTIVIGEDNPFSSSSSVLSVPQSLSSSVCTTTESKLAKGK